MLRVAIVLFVLTAATTAYAYKGVCSSPSDLIDRLEGRFGESLVSTGVTADNRLISTFANPDTGSWTFVVFNMQPKQACIVATGSGWRAIKYAAETPVI